MMPDQDMTSRAERLPKKTRTKEWKSLKITTDTDVKVRDFARRHRLTLADAYAVIVEKFCTLSSDEQSQAVIRKTAG